MNQSPSKQSPAESPESRSAFVFCLLSQWNWENPLTDGVRRSSHHEGGAAALVHRLGHKSVAADPPIESRNAQNQSGEREPGRRWISIWNKTPPPPPQKKQNTTGIDRSEWVESKEEWMKNVAITHTHTHTRTATHVHTHTHTRESDGWLVVWSVLSPDRKWAVASLGRLTPTHTHTQAETHTRTHTHRQRHTQAHARSKHVQTRTDQSRHARTVAYHLPLFFLVGGWVSGWGWVEFRSVSHSQDRSFTEFYRVFLGGGGFVPFLLRPPRLWPLPGLQKNIKKSSLLLYLVLPSFALCPVYCDLRLPRLQPLQNFRKQKKRSLPSFTEFYRVLPSFTEFWSIPYVLHRACGHYRASKDKIRSYLVLPRLT